MSILVLVRHGLSEYNKLGIWAGWDNPPLSPEGVEEAKAAGTQLANIHFNYAYASALIRAQQTLDEILSASKQTPPIVHNPALNERNYGDYTAKNKWEIKEQLGEAEFQKLRRSWDYPIPNGESLKQVYEREIPYFKEEIEPKLREDKNVIIASSGNALRAIVKYIENIPEDEIASLEIGTGEAYVYQLDENRNVISKEIRGVNEKKGKV